MPVRAVSFAGVTSLALFSLLSACEGAPLGEPGIVRAELSAPLPSFNVDLSKTSVSGLSSGGFMADQFHVAFSSELIGAGIMAGGPYFCAQGSFSTFVTQCGQAIGGPNASQLLGLAQNLATQGKIDSLANLANHKVYIFTSPQDTVIKPAVGTAARDFYSQAGVPSSNIKFVNNLSTGHGMITDDFGVGCSQTQSPYINDCNYDQAGDILTHLYGALNGPAASLSGSILPFDQSEFIPNPNSHSINDTGFVYVPASCSSGELCSVHVVFHGCNQTVSQIGDQFYTRSGYNEWADTNHMIVLYPQTKINSAQNNSGGCWDIWGLDDPNYHLKTGRQMAGVKAMITRLAGGTGGGGGDDDDVTPPAAPAGLATGAVTTSTIAVQWSANTEADLLGYNVYQATSAAGPFAKRNASPLTATNFSATGLSASTAYFFKASAIDLSGNESAQSSAVSATTSAQTGVCRSFAASNYAHVQAARAVRCGSFSSYTCAVGSNENLGLYNVFVQTTLYESPAGFFSKTPCQP